MRDLLALPVRLGGMGITNPVTASQHANEASVKITSPLVADIIAQDQSKTLDIFKVIETKASVRQSNCSLMAQQAEVAYEHLSPQLKRHIDLAKEKGASSWLSVLPIDDHGFSLVHSGMLSPIWLVTANHPNQV